MGDSDVRTLISSSGHLLIFKNYTFNANGTIRGIVLIDYEGEEEYQYQMEKNRRTFQGVNLLDPNE